MTSYAYARTSGKKKTTRFSFFFGFGHVIDCNVVVVGCIAAAASVPVAVRVGFIGGRYNSHY